MKTGGPAFPIADFDFHAFQPSEVEEHKRLLSGMTLLDYFAAKAMQGILANPGQLDNVNDEAAKWVARDAYRVATAMLKAREGE